MYKNRLGLHIGLFLITVVTTTLAGSFWSMGIEDQLYSWDFIIKGIPFSIAILFILSVHEFGHYFAARYHGVEASLPYFIPSIPVPFGTMGAVIRTRSAIPSNKAMFDIGVAGPIAGFVACLIVLVYGFTNLPGTEYILAIHPDYFEKTASLVSEDYLEFGDSLLFLLLRNVLPSTGDFVPPMSEIYHYPYLCVGWFGLFVTALNMIPVGQLDGGHVVYSMFGNKIHNYIGRIAVVLMLIMGSFGAVDAFTSFGLGFGWMGWLFWAILVIFVIKLKHPPVYFFSELDRKRKIAGYFSLFILVISFSPTPFYGAI